MVILIQLAIIERWSLLSNSNCIYFVMLAYFGNCMKLVHSLVSCMPAPLQSPRSNHASWLLESKMNKPTCSFWKMKLGLVTRKVCFQLYTLQTTWNHTPPDFNQDPQQCSKCWFSCCLIHCPVHVSIWLVTACHLGSLHTTLTLGHSRWQLWFPCISTSKTEKIFHQNR